MKTAMTWLGVLVAAALSAPAPAQTPPAAPPPDDDTPVIRVDVELVNIFFSARERKGNYVRGLEASDFEVYEDGKRQEIKFFARETDLPLTIGLRLTSRAKPICRSPSGCWWMSAAARNA